MTAEEHLTHRGAISQHVQSLPASGIRKFFDLLSIHRTLHRPNPHLRSAPLNVDRPPQGR